MSGRATGDYTVEQFAMIGDRHHGRGEEEMRSRKSKSLNRLLVSAIIVTDAGDRVEPAQ
jgi:hypothetical protein